MRFSMSLDGGAVASQEISAWGWNFRASRAISCALTKLGGDEADAHRVEAFPLQYADEIPPSREIEHRHRRAHVLGEGVAPEGAMMIAERGDPWALVT